jgi:hypothetical protein
VLAGEPLQGKDILVAGKVAPVLRAGWPVFGAYRPGCDTNIGLTGWHNKSRTANSSTTASSTAAKPGCFPGAAGVQMPCCPAPAVRQPPAIILFMPALRTPPAAGVMPMRGGATA